MSGLYSVAQGTLRAIIVSSNYRIVVKAVTAIILIVVIEILVAAIQMIVMVIATS